MRRNSSATAEAGSAESVEPGSGAQAPRHGTAARSTIAGAERMAVDNTENGTQPPARGEKRLSRAPGLAAPLLTGLLRGLEPPLRGEQLRQVLLDLLEGRVRALALAQELDGLVALAHRGEQVREAAAREVVVGVAREGRAVLLDRLLWPPLLLELPAVARPGASAERREVRRRHRVRLGPRLGQRARELGVALRLLVHAEREVGLRERDVGLGVALVARERGLEVLAGLLELAAVQVDEAEPGLC